MSESAYNNPFLFGFDFISKSEGKETFMVIDLLWLLMFMIMAFMVLLEVRGKH